jgi:excisionase family DNA binding protein
MTGTDLLTTGQIADLLGVNRVTVHHWATSGKLPIHSFANGIRLFRRTDVDAFIATRNAEAAS